MVDRHNTESRERALIEEILRNEPTGTPARKIQLERQKQGINFSREELEAPDFGFIDDPDVQRDIANVNKERESEGYQPLGKWASLQGVLNSRRRENSPLEPRDFGEDQNAEAEKYSPQDVIDAIRAIPVEAIDANRAKQAELTEKAKGVVELKGETDKFEQAAYMELLPKDMANWIRSVGGVGVLKEAQELFKSENPIAQRNFELQEAQLLLDNLRVGGQLDVDISRNRVRQNYLDNKDEATKAKFADKTYSTDPWKTLEDLGVYDQKTDRITRPEITDLNQLGAEISVAQEVINEEDQEAKANGTISARENEEIDAQIQSGQAEKLPPSQVGEEFEGSAVQDFGGSPKEPLTGFDIPTSGFKIPRESAESDEQAAVKAKNPKTAQLLKELGVDFNSVVDEFNGGEPDPNKVAEPAPVRNIPEPQSGKGLSKDSIPEFKAIAIPNFESLSPEAKQVNLKLREEQAALDARLIEQDDDTVNEISRAGRNTNPRANRTISTNENATSKGSNPRAAVSSASENDVSAPYVDQYTDIEHGEALRNIDNDFDADAIALSRLSPEELRQHDTKIIARILRDEKAFKSNPTKFDGLSEVGKRKRAKLENGSNFTDFEKNILRESPNLFVAAQKLSVSEEYLASNKEARLINEEAVSARKNEADTEMAESVRKEEAWRALDRQGRDSSVGTDNKNQAALAIARATNRTVERSGYLRTDDLDPTEQDSTYWSFQKAADVVVGAYRIAAAGGGSIPETVNAWLMRGSIASRNDKHLNTITAIDNKIKGEQVGYNEFVEDAIKFGGVTKEERENRLFLRNDKIKYLSEQKEALTRRINEAGWQQRLADAGSDSENFALKQQGIITDSYDNNIAVAPGEEKGILGFIATTGLAGGKVLANDIGLLGQMAAIGINSARGESDTNLAEIAKRHHETAEAWTMRADEFKAKIQDPAIQQDFKDNVSSQFGAMEPIIADYKAAVEAKDDTAIMINAAKYIHQAMGTFLSATADDPEAALSLTLENGVQFLAPVPFKMGAGINRMWAKSTNVKNLAGIEANNLKRTGLITQSYIKEFNASVDAINKAFPKLPPLTKQAVNTVPGIGAYRSMDAVVRRTEEALINAARTKHEVVAAARMTKLNSKYTAAMEKAKVKYDADLAGAASISKMGTRAGLAAIGVDSGGQAVSIYNNALKTYMEKTGGMFPNDADHSVMISAAITGGALDYFSDKMLFKTTGALRNIAKKRASKKPQVLGSRIQEEQILGKGIANRILRFGTAVENTLVKGGQVAGKVAKSPAGKLTAAGGTFLAASGNEALTEGIQTDLEINMANYLLGKDRKPGSDAEVFLGSAMGFAGGAGVAAPGVAVSAVSNTVSGTVKTATAAKDFVVQKIDDRNEDTSAVGFFPNKNNVNDTTLEQLDLNEETFKIVSQNKAEFTRRAAGVLETLHKNEESDANTDKIHMVLRHLNALRNQAEIDSREQLKADSLDEKATKKIETEKNKIQTQISQVMQRFADTNITAGATAASELISEFNEQTKEGVGDSKKEIDEDNVKKLARFFGSSPLAQEALSSATKEEIATLQKIAILSGSSDLALALSERIIALKQRGAERNRLGLDLGVGTNSALASLIEGDQNFVGLNEYITAAHTIINASLNETGDANNTAATNFITNTIHKQILGLKATKITRLQALRAAQDSFLKDGKVSADAAVLMEKTFGNKFEYIRPDITQTVINNIGEEIEFIRQAGISIVNSQNQKAATNQKPNLLEIPPNRTGRDSFQTVAEKAAPDIVETEVAGEVVQPDEVQFIDDNVEATATPTETPTLFDNKEQEDIEKVKKPLADATETVASAETVQAQFDLSTLTYEDIEPYSVTLFTKDGTKLQTLIFRSQEDAITQAKVFRKRAKESKQDIDIKVKKARKITRIEETASSLFGDKEQSSIRINREILNSLPTKTVAELEKLAATQFARAKGMDESNPALAGLVYSEAYAAESMAATLKGKPLEDLSDTYLLEEAIQSARQAEDTATEMLMYEQLTPSEAIPFLKNLKTALEEQEKLNKEFYSRKNAEYLIGAFDAERQKFFDESDRPHIKNSLDFSEDQAAKIDEQAKEYNAQGDTVRAKTRKLIAEYLKRDTKLRREIIAGKQSLNLKTPLPETVVETVPEQQAQPVSEGTVETREETPVGVSSRTVDDGISDLPKDQQAAARALLRQAELDNERFEDERTTSIGKTLYEKLGKFLMSAAESGAIAVKAKLITAEELVAGKDYRDLFNARNAKNLINLWFTPGKNILNPTTLEILNGIQNDEAFNPEALGLTEQSDIHIAELIQDMYRRVRKTLDTDIGALTKLLYNEDITKDPRQFTGDHVNFLKHFTPNGVIEEEVKQALALAITNYALTYKESLNFNSEEGIVKMFNLNYEKGERVANEIVEQYRYTGINLPAIRKEVGDQTWRYLGYKGKPNYPAKDEYKFAHTLGVLAAHIMENNNDIFEVTKIDSDVFFADKQKAYTALGKEFVTDDRISKASFKSSIARSQSFSGKDRVQRSEAVEELRSKLQAEREKLQTLNGLSNEQNTELRNINGDLKILNEKFVTFIKFRLPSSMGQYRNSEIIRSVLGYIPLDPANSTFIESAEGQGIATEENKIRVAVSQYKMDKVILKKSELKMPKTTKNKNDIVYKGELSNPPEKSQKNLNIHNNRELSHFAQLYNFLDRIILSNPDEKTKIWGLELLGFINLNSEENKDKPGFWKESAEGKNINLMRQLNNHKDFIDMQTADGINVVTQAFFINYDFQANTRMQPTNSVINPLANKIDRSLLTISGNNPTSTQEGSMDTIDILRKTAILQKMSKKSPYALSEKDLAADVERKYSNLINDEVFRNAVIAYLDLSNEDLTEFLAENGKTSHDALNAFLEISDEPTEGLEIIIDEVNRTLAKINDEPTYESRLLVGMDGISNGLALSITYLSDTIDPDISNILKTLGVMTTNSDVEFLHELDKDTKDVYEMVAFDFFGELKKLEDSLLNNKEENDSNFRAATYLEVFRNGYELQFLDMESERAKYRDLLKHRVIAKTFGQSFGTENDFITLFIEAVHNQVEALLERDDNVMGDTNLAITQLNQQLQIMGSKDVTYITKDNIKSFNLRKTSFAKDSEQSKGFGVVVDKFDDATNNILYNFLPNATKINDIVKTQNTIASVFLQALVTDAEKKLAESNSGLYDKTTNLPQELMDRLIGRVYPLLGKLISPNGSTDFHKRDQASIAKVVWNATGEAFQSGRQVINKPEASIEASPLGAIATAMHLIEAAIANIGVANSPVVNVHDNQFALLHNAVEQSLVLNKAFTDFANNFDAFLSNMQAAENTMPKTLAEIRNNVSLFTPEQAREINVAIITAIQGDNSFRSGESFDRRGAYESFRNILQSDYIGRNYSDGQVRTMLNKITEVESSGSKPDIEALLDIVTESVPIDESAATFLKDILLNQTLHRSLVKSLDQPSQIVENLKALQEHIKLTIDDAKKNPKGLRYKVAGSQQYSLLDNSYKSEHEYKAVTENVNVKKGTREKVKREKQLQQHSKALLDRQRKQDERRANAEIQRFNFNNPDFGSSPSVIDNDIEFGGAGTQVFGLTPSNLKDLISMLQTTGDRVESDEHMKTLLRFFSPEVMNSLEAIQLHYNDTGRNVNAGGMNYGQSGLDIYLNANSVVNKNAKVKDSNGVPMSGAETLVHEVLHTLTFHLIDTGHPIMRQLDLMRKAVRDRGLVTPEDLIPEGDTSPNALARAQVTWDSMFVESTVSRQSVPIAGVESVGTRNRSNHLHEFIVRMGSNEKMRKALEIVGKEENDKNASFKIKLSQKLKQLFNYLARKIGGYRFDSTTPNYTKEFDAVMQDLFSIQSRHQNKAFRALNAVVTPISYAADKVGEVTSYVFDGARNNILSPNITGKYGASINSVIDLILEENQDVKHDVIKPLLEGLEKKISTIQMSLVRDFLTEIQGTTDKTRWAANANRFRNTIESKERQEVISTVLAELSRPFFEGRSRKVEAEIKRTLLNGFIKPDLAALMDSEIAKNENKEDGQNFYTVKARTREEYVKYVSGLLSGREIDSEIAATRDEINKVIGHDRLANVVHNQMQSIGYHLIHQKHTYGMAVNSVNGAIRKSMTSMNYGFKDSQAFDMRVLEFHANKLATLESINYLDKTEKQAALDLMTEHSKREEQNDGVFKMLSTHKLLQEKAKESELFSEGRLYFSKGYFKEVASNKDLTTLVAPIADTEKLASRMYQKVSDIQRSPFDPSEERMGLFITEYSSTTVEKLQGALSPADKPAVGGSFFDRTKQIVNELPDGTLVYDIDMDFEVLRRRQENHILKVMTQPVKNKFIPTEFHQANSVLISTKRGEEEGNEGRVKLVDYRGQMSWKDKVEKLATKEDPFEILASTAGNHVSKVRGRKVNEEVINEMLQDVKENFKDMPLGSYVWIGKDSGDRQSEEAWAQIPKESRQFIFEKTSKNGLYVRKDLANQIFGYRKVSVRNLLDYLDTNIEDAEGYRKLMLETTNRFLAQAMGQNAFKIAVFTEDTLQNLTEIIKDSIVVKTLEVTLVNTLSNTIQLMSNGMSVTDAITYQLEGMVNAVHYSKDHSERRKLSLQVNQLRENSSHKRDLVRQVAEIDERLATNPVAFLMEAGAMQTIVEDIAAYSVVDENLNRKPITRFAGKALDKTPRAVQTAMTFAFMGKDTAIYNVANNAVKLSDFSARYALMKHLDATRPKMSTDQKISKVMDEFIDYDIPTNRWIQYGNDIGFFWFTKYGLRSTRVAANLAFSHPKNIARLFMFERYFGDISTVMDFHPDGRFGEPISRFDDAIMDQAVFKTATLGWD